MICRAWKEGIPDGSRKEELEFKQIEGGSGLQSPGWVWTRVRTVENSDRVRDLDDSEIKIINSVLTPDL